MRTVTRPPAPGEVVVLDPRVLRRVIKRHRKLPGLGLDVPHVSCYALPRQHLLDIVGLDELGRDVKSLPETVIVLPREAEDGAEDDPDVALRRRWRGVFHAKVHVALEAKLGEGELTAAAIRERIHRLGQCEFDEARTTLRQARKLLDPTDDRETWAEFAATYVELRTFQPRLVMKMFPTLLDLTRVDALVAEDVDGPAILEASRPAGVTGPISADAAPSSGARPPSRRVADTPLRDEHVATAKRAREKGNLVRAALASLAAADAEGEADTAANKRAEVHVAAARVDLDALSAKLDRALGSRTDARTRSAWTDAFAALAGRAVSGARAERCVEARALFDVQTACREAERTPKKVELAAFVRSLGKKRIVRELPAAREIRVARKLRKAEERAVRARLAPEERRRIAELFHGVRERANHAFRAALRPKVETALKDVGLVPTSAVERAALATIVEKLLDGAEARGFFGIGLVRDAISRSALKLPNIDLGSFLRGDALLRADRKLGGALDGVYHEGEIYLRFLQRVSAVVFGTLPGRLFTLHLALPFLVAFVALEGLGHLVHAVGSRVGLPEIHLATWWSIAGLTVVVYLLIHFVAVRAAAVRSARAVGSGAYTALVVAPKWFASTVGLVKLVKSRPFRLFMRFVAIPGGAAAGAWFGTGRVIAEEVITRGAISGVTFVAIAAALNSRFGLLAEEVATDWLARRIRWFGNHVVPSVFRLVMDFFAWLLELVERGLYAVDEFLRFREGENRAALVAKVMFGFVWFFVAYVVRLYTNLLVEPQVNPIKHFPVVTVSHKLILPMTNELLHTANGWLTPLLGAVGANAIVAPTVLLLPGVFGFLAWELKENFNLYAQNRSPKLGAVMVGHHGETMGGLLVPGFHAGTVPKLYTKLRRASVRNDGSAGKYEDQLLEARDAIAEFVEREIVALTETSPAWRAGALKLDGVDLAASRVRIGLKLAGAPHPMVLSFEEQSGHLVGGVVEAGFADGLEDDARLVLENLLAGVYRLTGCDLVRQTIEHEIEGAAYDIADEGLVVWPGPGYRTELVYALSTVGVVVPRHRGDAPEAQGRAIDTRRLLVREQSIRFTDWRDAWDAERPHRLAIGASLLPPRRTPPADEADEVDERAAG